jgi:hypothetical protein
MRIAFFVSNGKKRVLRSLSLGNVNVNCAVSQPFHDSPSKLFTASENHCRLQLLISRIQ